MKKVLLFAPFGQFAVHHQLDAILAKALRLRGCEVEVVTCDGIFKTCDVLAWAGNNAAKICLECAGKSKALFGRFNLPIRQLRDYLCSADFDQANRWVMNLDVESYAAATFKGKPIGDWATSSVFSHFRITAASLNRPEVRQAHQQYLANALLTWKALTRLLEVFSPEAMVVFNGRMTPYRVAIEVAREHGIRILGHERGMTPGSFTLYENASCCEPESIFRHIDSWLKVPLSQTDIDRCLSLTRRETGAHLNYPAFYDFQTQAEEARRALNIPTHARILGVFTSSEFELANNRSYRSVTSQLEYIDRLIEVFRDRDDYLVVRHHPNIAGDSTVVADHDFLRRAWHQAQNAPRNVRIVMPSEKFTSYALIPHLSGAIAFFSSTGQESIARGVAAAALPQSYSHQSATFQVTDTTTEGWRNLVDQLFAKTAAFEAADFRTCYRFLSAYITRHSSKFATLDIKNFFEANITLASDEQLLPDQDSILDQACEFIINGTPIFTPPTLADLSRDTSVEEAFFDTELALVKANREKVNLAKPEPLAQPVSAAASVAVLRSHSNTDLSPSWVARSRHHTLRTYDVGSEGNLSLTQIKEALLQVSEPFVLLAPETHAFDESLIATCVAKLGEDSSLKGVRFGAWVARENGVIDGEIFTPRNPCATFFEATAVWAALHNAISQLTFALHRTDSLRNLIDQALAVETIEQVATTIFEVIGADDYFKLHAPMVMVKPPSSVTTRGDDFQVPAILFLVFNRYDLTQQVFEAIRAQRPTKLFLAADGPRDQVSGEQNVCESIRNWLLSRIDWACEVKTLFRDHNLGCKRAVSSAITWFFEHVEEGIILEDDCLPEADFFRLSADLLKRYRHEPKVMQIAGVNFQHGRHRGDGSYYFSKYPHIWGWATWRRAWQHYDISAAGLDEFLKSDPWQQLCFSTEEADYWEPLFRNVRDGQIDTWDFQWTYAVWRSAGLTALPQVNLVTNLGFRSDATHTTDSSAQLSLMTTRQLGPIIHSTILEANREADLFTFLNTFTTAASRKALAKIKKGKQKDKTLLKAATIKSELSTIKKSLVWRLLGKPLHSIEKRLFKSADKH